MMQKHLIFVSDALPVPGFGSSVVFYRHLKRLEGWKISIIVPKQPIEKEYDIPASWQIFMFPEHRWWWPPVKHRLPGSFKLRLHLLKWECMRFLTNDGPAVILNQFGRNSMLAFYLSKALRTPLAIMICDRWEVWVKSGIEASYMSKKWADIILNHASVIWSHSPGLTRYYTAENRKKISTLYALPEKNTYGFVQWEDRFKTHPVIGFTGSFHSHQIQSLQMVAQALQQVAGTLLVISRKNDIIKPHFKNFSNIEYREPFADDRELLRYLGENITSMLVPGSIDLNAPGWSLSFPSKLLQFSQLGVPIIIMEPPNTTLFDWAERHKWYAYLNATDSTKLLELVEGLRDKDVWLKMAEQSREIASNEFNPDKLQAQFESELETTFLF